MTGVEAALGTTYTADTLRKLKARLPGVRLVWMMGADNLASFHRWRDWQGIAADVPIAVFNRPGQALRALSSPAARTLAPSPDPRAGRPPDRRDSAARMGIPVLAPRRRSPRPSFAQNANLRIGVLKPSPVRPYL